MSLGCVDSSALASILLGEPEAPVMVARLEGYHPLVIAAPTLVECRIALSRRFERDARPEIERLLGRFKINVVPFTAAHADVAQDAFLRYGKGRHPASLNFGDCMVYAAAKIAHAELIYVGDDFALTDLA